MCGIELLFETSSTSHSRNSNSCPTVRAAQRKHRISHQNVSPNRSKSRFSLICSTLPQPTLFPMNFLECLVVSHTCIWYRTSTTHNLSQNELAKLELCPKNRPKSINNFGPTLSHLARWFPKSRVWYRITLRDKLYESLEEFEFVLDSARSATETPNFTPKCVTKSLEIAIFAHMLDHCSTCIFPMNFLKHLVRSTTCIWYRTRTIHNLSQNELVQLELCSKMSPKTTNNFDRMLTHFARWFPKSRAKCRITLRDKLYESLGESDLLSDSARSAAETPNFSPKYATKSLKIMNFAHMQNLGLACIFSNEFSGTPRVFHNLHMI